MGAGPTSLALQLHRLSPVLRKLRRLTDPLFDHAGGDLDEREP
jgi:hypothetical protein